jgi:hypothetical protein
MMVIRNMLVFSFSIVVLLLCIILNLLPIFSVELS